MLEQVFVVVGCDNPFDVGDNPFVPDAALYERLLLERESAAASDRAEFIRQIQGTSDSLSIDVGWPEMYPDRKFEIQRSGMVEAS